ncbi:MAG: glutamate-5-semialdehyde dehydrogenase [Proteobacteria bacterium]|nr:glutamate-5-semialdehyde dehydrogenase [Pseudomonadota bacterium]
MAQSKTIETEMQRIGKQARAAARILAVAEPAQKNKALKSAAAALRKAEAAILKANAKDVALAKKNNVAKAFIERLELNSKRIEAMAKGLEEIAALKDPVGHSLAKWKRPNGLTIERVSVPLGVIGIIYESRPNVTADAGALCLKSGNAAILRGGTDSFHSSQAILECLQKGLQAAGLPAHVIQSVPVKDREAVGAMLRMDQYIDVIVPRGGKGLIKRVIEESRIPLLQHLDGNCHTYVHSAADISMAVKVILNAKMRRTGVCGATESLVLDEKIAAKALPKIADVLAKEGCELRGDAASRKIDKRIKAANDEDYRTEYLDSIMSVKIVKGLEQAIDFINQYSSHHTEAIITKDKKAAARFLKYIDSAIVMHNASTQFADGGEFGMGAEIGIATGRLHARGPVGVEQLTTYKYVLHGSGQIRPK